MVRKKELIKVSSFFYQLYYNSHRRHWLPKREGPTLIKAGPFELLCHEFLILEAFRLLVAEAALLVLLVL